MQKVILDLCGGSGAWSKPYQEVSDYKVIVLDYPRDVRLVSKPPFSVYGILAAPPCTMFANSGARWKRSKEDMLAALSVVDACLRMVLLCRPKFWALENPIGKLKKYLGAPYYRFHPCDFGDPYTKKTLLWGKFNLPIKTPVEPAQGSKMHFISPSKNRQKLRSITPPGFARAFFNSNR